MTTPDPRMRAADSDRQATVDRLSEHFTAGRLTAMEYDERVRQAYAVTYLDELPALLADLPDDRPDDGYAGWGGDERAWRGQDQRWGGDGNPWDGGESGWRRDPGSPWTDAGYGPAGHWRGRPGGYRHRRHMALVPVILGVLLLIALTHGFFLIPLFWIGLALLVFGRHRHGGCGRRFGPRSAP